MNTPKVSIIIPIFNVEAYIEQCANSLFNQTMDDGLEFIFINDCSTDNSLNVLRKSIECHPQRQHQIKIIEHQENKGVAASRQDGLNVAAGKYIIHCDPDDYVESKWCELLYAKACSCDADCVICDYNEDINGLVIPHDQYFDNTSSESVLGAIAGRKNKIWGVLWNKLIARSVYQKYKFESGINFCEDVLILFKIFSENIKICHIGERLYNYRKFREGSEKKQLQEWILAKDINLFNAIEQLAKNSTSAEYQKACISFIQEQIISREFRYSKLSDKKYKLLYRRYFNHGQFNHTFPFIVYLLADISSRGYHKCSIRVYNILCSIADIIHKKHR